MFLILFGVLGKISGVFLASERYFIHSSDPTSLLTPNNTVPNPVLGGVTTFLFASVAVSGIRVLDYTQFTRRDRFVLAAALSFGVGDLLVPGIFTHLFDGVNHPNKGLQGLFDSITIILSTPCQFVHVAHTEDAALILTPTVLVAGIVAAVLNLILPQEDPQEEDDEDDSNVEVVDVEARFPESEKGIEP